MVINGLLIPKHDWEYVASILFSGAQSAELCYVQGHLYQAEPGQVTPMLRASIPRSCFWPPFHLHMGGHGGLQVDRKVLCIHYRLAIYVHNSAPLQVIFSAELFYSGSLMPIP